jgi:glycosyltransferase involved in cell wall biosynthesis
VSEPLVVVDADVLGRHRTGDETYVRNLLRELGSLADASGFRIAAVTRHPELVPAGIEPLVLRTPLQELRMLRTLPQLLRRTGAALVHTQYAVPVRSPCPAVVTIHDLSFEHGSAHMPLRDRLLFRRIVPHAARAARRVLTVSERTRADLVLLYGLPEEKVVVTPNGVDPAFTPGNNLMLGTYVLAVGAVQPRKNQLTALAAAEAAMLPLVVAGPVKDEALAARLREAGADLRGYVPQEELAELYRGAACLVQPSRFEGFGLPMLEAMASGTPVVALDEPALREVAGDAAVFVDEAHLADGVRRALGEREQLVAAGLERVKAFSWRATAERTLDVYREALA